jgi:hypothetical protein
MKLKKGRNMECEACNKPFYCSPSRLKNNSFSCSLKCLSILNRKKYRTGTEEVCEVCKKHIYYKKYRAKKTKNKTCSFKCRGVLCQTIYQGNNNPNKKHFFDTSMFGDINTEEKAYILGLIAADGHVKRDGVVISLHKKDRLLLERISLLIYNKNTLKDIFW